MFDDHRAIGARRRPDDAIDVCGRIGDRLPLPACESAQAQVTLHAVDHPVGSDHCAVDGVAAPPHRGNVGPKGRTCVGLTRGER